MKSLSTSISVFVMAGFSGKSVQNELLLNFVSDKCEILILATRIHVNLIISTSNMNATGLNMSDPTKKCQIQKK